MERYYRMLVSHKDLVDFKVIYKSTDLFVSAEKNFSKKTENLVKKCRNKIEEFIYRNPNFESSLKPIKVDYKVDPIIKFMIEASYKTGVGPMATVAGAVAEYVGKGLLKYSKNVIIENGGDIFLSSTEDRIIGIYAGESSLSNKIGVKIKIKQMPCGVCTSSGKIGHSLSFGKADAVAIFANSSILADAVATAACNIVNTSDDIEKAINFSKNIIGVWGVIIIYDDKLGSWGDINIISLKK